MPGSSKGHDRIGLFVFVVGTLAFGVVILCRIVCCTRAHFECHSFYRKDQQKERTRKRKKEQETHGKEQDMEAERKKEHKKGNRKNIKAQETYR